MKKGVVHLDVAHQICQKGDKLTPEQARLLKLFEHMQAEFKIKVKMGYSKASEQFEIIDASVDEEELVTESDDEEEEEEEEGEEEEEAEVQTKKKKTKADQNNNV